MNKNLLYKLLAIVMLASLVLTACGGSVPSQDEITRLCDGKPAGAKVTAGTGNNQSTVTCDGSTWKAPDWMVAAAQEEDAPATFETDDGYTVTREQVLASAGLVTPEATEASAEETAVATFTPTQTQVPAATNTQVFTATPVFTATVPPTATEVSCLQALSKSVNRPYQWLANLDVGDPRFTSILFTKNGSGNSLVAIIDPVFNYDVEAPSMTGVFYQTAETSMSDILCAALELAEQNEVTNLVYIGFGDTPDGFTRDYKVDGFTTSVWIYTEEPIETGSAHWATFTAAKSDATHTYGDSEAYSYGQFWNGLNSKTVYHWISEPGWQISTPALQGSHWEVSDWSDVMELVLARFIQMTGEVEQRDDRPTVVKVYCGEGEAPTGYSAPAQPNSDWVCEQIP